MKRTAGGWTHDFSVDVRRDGRLCPPGGIRIRFRQTVRRGRYPRSEASTLGVHRPARKTDTSSVDVCRGGALPRPSITIPPSRPLDVTPQLRFAAQPSVRTGPPRRGRRGDSAPAGAGTDSHASDIGHWLGMTPHFIFINPIDTVGFICYPLLTYQKDMLKE